MAAVFVGASSSRSVLQEVKEEEEEEEEEREEEVVELLDSADKFEVFNRPQSPEVISDNMGIQRKNQTSLLDVIEGKPEKRRQGSPLKPPSPLLLLLKYPSHKG